MIIISHFILMDTDTFKKLLGMAKTFQDDLAFTRKKLREDLRDELDRNEQNAAEQVQYQKDFFEEDHQDFENDIAKKNERIAELEGLLNTRQGKIAEINPQITDKQGEIETLSYQLRLVNEENASLNDRLKKMLDQNLQMRDALINDEKQRVEFEFYENDLKDKTDQLSRMGTLEGLYKEGEKALKDRIKHKTDTQLKKLNEDIGSYNEDANRAKAEYEGDNGLKAKCDKMFAELEAEDKKLREERATFLKEADNHARNKIQAEDIKAQHANLLKQSDEKKAQIENLNKVIDDYNSHRNIVKKYPEDRYEYRQQVVSYESKELHEDRWIICPVFSWDNKVMEGEKKKIVYQRRLIISDDWNGHKEYGEWEEYKTVETDTYHKT